VTETVARRALLGSLALPAVVRAEVWPVRPLTLVVPFVPGGLPDANGRFMAQRLAALLGQPVVVENRPGAGGGIGAESVAKARPDGYTLLLGTMGTHGSNPALYRTLGYDAMRDFTPVHALFADNNLAVVGADGPHRSLDDIALAARLKPGGLNYGSGGIGSGVHLAGALFQRAAGIDIVHVLYRGTPAALADVVAGRLDLIFDYLVTSLPLVQAGRLRPLAWTGTQRLALLPEVPTIAEAGFPEAALDVWSGLFLPAGAPPEFAATLASATELVLGQPETVAWAARTESRRMLGLSGERFRAFIAAELLRWRWIVEFAGARLE